VKMRSLFDVNLLLALFQPDHVHFERAQEWWKTNEKYGWASCPLTQNGFARILSQQTYRKPMPTAEAIARLAEQIERTDHEFWPDDVSITDRGVFEPSGILGPNQITDAYLLALAVKKGGRLATLDQAVSLRAVRGAELRHLAVL
jgi:toxin-antitoxin system PIN domain toxin